eukprot:COSAG05_NODE_2471_length_3023_cov_1.479822_2_plen_480_part_00
MGRPPPALKREPSQLLQTTAWPRRDDVTMQADEKALVKALIESELFVEYVRLHARKRGNRRPSSLAAVDRRWFVGKQSIAAAEKAYLALRTSGALLDVGSNESLVGTAALLQMARANHPQVSEREGKNESYISLILRVRGRKRGRPKTGLSMEAQRFSERVYYVHKDITAACLAFAAAHSTRQMSSKRGAHNAIAPPIAFAVQPIKSEESATSKVPPSAEAPTVVNARKMWWSPIVAPRDEEERGPIISQCCVFSSESDEDSDAPDYDTSTSFSSHGSYGDSKGTMVGSSDDDYSHPMTLLKEDAATHLEERQLAGQYASCWQSVQQHQQQHQRAVQADGSATWSTASEDMAAATAATTAAIVSTATSTSAAAVQQMMKRRHIIRHRRQRREQQMMMMQHTLAQRDAFFMHSELLHGDGELSDIDTGENNSDQSMPRLSKKPKRTKRSKQATTRQAAPRLVKAMESSSVVSFQPAATPA